ncbi:MAG: DNA-binding protein [Acidovorax sp.]
METARLLIPGLNATCVLPASVYPSASLKNRLNVTRLVELDCQFREFAKLQQHATPRCGWTKTIRLAFGMSSNTLGQRLRMSGQGVRKLEAAEADGSISLKTLTRLAGGLDCEVRYVLVPRTSLMEQVLARVQELAGSPAAVAPVVETAFREADVLQALTVMLGQINKRGLW